MKYKLNHIDIREAVSKLCLKFDGKYWQNCDRNNSYPEEFVQALTDAGYLSSLIPEESFLPMMDMQCWPLEILIMSQQSK